MKPLRILNFLALMTLLWSLNVSCKKDEPQPLHTEINAQTISESGWPLDSIQIDIAGSTGCYFCGTRKDTLFAVLVSNQEGKAQYIANFDPKWRVYVKAIGRNYDFEKYQDRMDGQIEVGKVNNVVMFMRKR